MYAYLKSLHKALSVVDFSDNRFIIIIFMRAWLYKVYDYYRISVIQKKNK